MTVPHDDEPLSNDPATVQALVRELLEALAAERRQSEELHSRLDQILRLLYGPKYEKLSNTPSLFGDEPAATTPEKPVEPPPPLEPSGRRRHGRRKLPRDLPRRRVEHDLGDAEKLFPCCRNVRVRIGEEVTERLDYPSSSLFVVEHVRPKYACRNCHTQLTVAALPPEPVPKSVATAGLLAHIITVKFADHLPLHRLEGILGQYGVELSRSTMCDWLAGCALALRPLYGTMCDRVRRSKVIHRRHPGAGTGPDARSHPHGSHLGLRRRREQPLHRLRRDAEPQPRRAVVVPEVVHWLLAGRCLRRLRQVVRYRGDRGRLLGASAAEVLRSKRE